jgi:hypothetical protein
MYVYTSDGSRKSVAVRIRYDNNLTSANLWKARLYLILVRFDGPDYLSNFIYLSINLTSTSIYVQMCVH